MTDRTRSALRGIKLAIVVLLGAGLVVVALQNTAVVELRLFGWTFQSRRFVIIVLSVVAGIVIGWLAARLRR